MKTAPDAGIERFARWMVNTDVRCPQGHHVPRRIIPAPAGFIQCAEPVGQHARCGRWIYVVACNAAALAYVVPTTYERARDLAVADLSPMEVMDRLGVAIPGAETIVGPAARSA